MVGLLSAPIQNESCIGWIAYVLVGGIINKIIQVLFSNMLTDAYHNVF